MGKSTVDGRAALRFSTGEMITEEDISGALEIMKTAAPQGS